MVYLGAIRALENRLLPKVAQRAQEKFPVLEEGVTQMQPVTISATRALIKIGQRTDKRIIKGVSGSSAGAITAFMLACGFSSLEIEKELNTFHKKTLRSQFGSWPFAQEQSKDFYISSFDNFFDGPDNRTLRAVTPSGNKQIFINRENISELIKEIMRIAELDIIEETAFIASDSYLLHKLMFDQNTAGRDAEHRAKYVHSLIYNLGLFPGIAIREYFATLLFENVIEPLLENDQGYYPSQPDPYKVTFKQFFEMTGTDLVVTGTNLRTSEPKYFSVYHTPDFPVIDAVGISMSIPFIFKPVVVNYPVDGNIQIRMKIMKESMPMAE